MRLPGPLRRNIGLKLASILLSLIIYLHVYTDRVHETKLWLPVVIKGLPDSLAAIGPAPSRALVLLRGRGKELLKLRWRAPVIEVDLSGAAAGRFTHSLSPAEVRISSTSEATAMAVLEPRVFAIELDRVTTRSLPVALRFTGGLPAGYRLDEIRLEPTRVTVRGPSRLLPALDSLEAGPVDLRGLRGRAAGEFQVRTPVPELKAMPPAVRVELGVERVVTREIDGIDVRVVADPMFVGYAEPKHATLQVSGLIEAAQSVDAKGLEVIVDARGLGPGVHELQGLADTLQGVSLVPVPDRFRVTIEPAAAGQRGGPGRRRGRRKGDAREKIEARMGGTKLR